MSATTRMHRKGFTVRQRARGFQVWVDLWRFHVRLVIWRHDFDRDRVILFAAILDWDWGVLAGLELVQDGLALETHPEATPAYWYVGWRGRWRTLKREAV